jgi:prophage DNA circulation protein
MKNAVTRTDLNTKLAVPTADVADNVDLVDVIGNKTDAAVTTAGTTKSIMAYIKGLISNVSTVDTVVDDIQTDLSNATDGLGAIKTAVDTVDTNVDTLISNRPKMVERTAANLPQTAQTAYFTVTGKVLISDIVGEVTTVIEGGTNNLELYSNPTVGADVALCTAVDIDADAVGTMYHITGTLADAMIATTSGAFPSQVIPIIVAAGTIDVKTSASKTGATKWVLYYLPLTAGASVTVA